MTLVARAMMAIAVLALMPFTLNACGGDNHESSIGASSTREAEQAGVSSSSKRNIEPRTGGGFHPEANKARRSRESSERRDGEPDLRTGGAKRKAPVRPSTDDAKVAKGTVGEQAQSNGSAPPTQGDAGAGQRKAEQIAPAGNTDAGEAGQ
jgi:hypothetical protein